MTTDLKSLLEQAQEIACRVVLDYGEGDAQEHQAATAGKLWNDHPAVQAALDALKSSAEHAKKLEAENERKEAALERFDALILQRKDELGCLSDEMQAVWDDARGGRP